MALQFLPVDLDGTLQNKAARSRRFANRLYLQPNLKSLRIAEDVAFVGDDNAADIEPATDVCRLEVESTIANRSTQ